MSGGADTLAFLSPGPDATARSSMEYGAVAAGAVIEQRDGWNVATSFGDRDTERAFCESSVGFADMSHLGKIELHGDPAAITGQELTLGTALRADGAWFCPYSPHRAFVLCDPADTAALRDRFTAAAASASGLASVFDATTSWGALTAVGPLARELFARFTAIDLRPKITPVFGFRPGSVARGGPILCEAPDRYLMLFGSAYGQYVWTVVSDAAEHLGGGPVGVDALEPLDA